MTPELFKSYFYPSLAGLIAVALVIDGLFYSKEGSHLMTALALLAPGVVGKK
jgi:hypothetical protein